MVHSPFIEKPSPFEDRRTWEEARHAGSCLEPSLPVSSTTQPWLLNRAKDVGCSFQDEKSVAGEARY